MTAAPTATRASTSQRLPVAHPTAVLVLVLATYLMIIVDTSVVITGLPDIQADLALTATGLSWVQGAYALAFGSVVLLSIALLLVLTLVVRPRRGRRPPPHECGER